MINDRVFSRLISRSLQEVLDGLSIEPSPKNKQDARIRIDRSRSNAPSTFRYFRMLEERAQVYG